MANNLRETLSGTKGFSIPEDLHRVETSIGERYGTKVIVQDFNIDVDPRNMNSNLRSLAECINELECIRKKYVNGDSFDKVAYLVDLRRAELTLDIASIIVIGGFYDSTYE